MPTSLLSLPDELLVLVVDQAIGEYAPRLYKQRQETACALALVNKRVGRIAGDKLLQAVHISFGPEYDRDGVDISAVHESSKVHAMQVHGLHQRDRLFSFPSFASVRDLRLVGATHVNLDDVSQLLGASPT